jgi:hypothetical protein
VPEMVPEKARRWVKPSRPWVPPWVPQALSVTQRDTSVTGEALYSVTQRDTRVTRRALSVTQRDTSVTGEAL